MLSKKLAEKYYQERINAESYSRPYTEEELKCQKEVRKEIEAYKKSQKSR
ncbi:hypothetical protein SN811_17930 [Ligilactobacillus agilis]|uniref:Uncharacterized protein n=1 Tax=Ligilactobacillus agilis TaxID=1601 RepID=A0A6F9Y6U2_9LACO|nr:hypothetical protein SN811_17930 [Ligilactobacillus agilis]